MAETETNLILQNNTKPREWKRCIDEEYIERFLSEVTFDSRQSGLEPQKHKTAGRILSFATTYPLR